MSPQQKIRLETLRTAPLDRWIALSADESRIIAVGNTYTEVSDLVDSSDDPEATILRTPTAWEPLSVSAIE